MKTSGSVSKKNLRLVWSSLWKPGPWWFNKLQRETGLDDHVLKRVLNALENRFHAVHRRYEARGKPVIYRPALSEVLLLYLSLRQRVKPRMRGVYTLRTRPVSSTALVYAQKINRNAIIPFPGQWGGRKNIGTYGYFVKRIRKKRL